LDDDAPMVVAQQVAQEYFSIVPPSLSAQLIELAQQPSQATGVIA
jgi:hypothetical protein